MLNYEFPPLGGGASPFSYECARELVSLGHEVDAVTMRYPGLPRFESIDGIKVYRVPCLRGRKDICRTREMASYLVGALPLILKLARTRNYDLNHSHFILPTGCLALILKMLTKIPYVITAHGSDVPGYNPDRFKAQHLLIRPLWKTIINHASIVVAPTEYLKGMILRHHPKARVETIPNGFDYGKFLPDQPKDKRVLVVTRMLQRKGVQYLLEALRGMELDGFQVDIVGDGPYLGALKKMASEFDLDVHFWGWLDNKSVELKDLYERSSIFVFTSERENFPMVLMEAMASGQAIITVDDTGCPEVVGNTALFVPPREPKALRAALLRLMHDSELRNRLKKYGRARVEECFSWGIIGRAYSETFKACATPSKLPVKR